MSHRLIGATIRRFDRIVSTNTYLKRNAAFFAEGTVVVANEQTGGRGRGDKVWLSQRGKCLAFSFFISPKIESQHLPFYNLFSAVAVAQCLGEMLIKAYIKWPNDILLDGKKIGGILVESIARPEKRIDMVIGIGLNVLQNEADFPSEWRGRVGSILSLTGQKVAIENLFQNLLDGLNALYPQTRRAEGREKIRQSWMDFCGHINREIQLERNGRILSGLFLGVDENGFALVQTQKNIVKVTDYQHLSLKENYAARD